VYVRLKTDNSVGSANANSIVDFLPADVAAQESAFGTSAYTKFLNVAVSQTVTAISAPMLVFTYDDVQSAYAGTTLAAAKSAFGFIAFDQAGQIATSAANAMTYVDKASDGVSEYAGIVFGLEAPLAKTAVFTGQSVTSSSVAANAAAVTAHAGSTLSTIISESFTSYKYRSATAAGFVSSTYVSGLSSTARACSEQMPNSVGGSTLYAGSTLTATGYDGTTTSLVDTPNLTNPEPTVIAYASVVAGGRRMLVPLGAATKVMETSTAGTTPKCQDKITRQYQYTFTPGAQRTLLPWTTGSGAMTVVFMYQGPAASAHAVFGKHQAISYYAQ